MPPKSKRKHPGDYFVPGAQDDNQLERVHSASRLQVSPTQANQQLQIARPAVMAATVQTTPDPFLVQPPYGSTSRPTLPPISQLDVYQLPPPAGLLPYPSPTNVFSQSPLGGRQPLPGQTTVPQTQSAPVGDLAASRANNTNSGDQKSVAQGPYGSSEISSGPRSTPSIPLKRPHPFEPSSSMMDRMSQRDLPPTSHYPSQLPRHNPLNTSSSPGDMPDMGTLQFPRSSTGSISDISTPTAPSAPYTSAYYNRAGSQAGSDYSTGSTTQRCILHIRQQPRAARAGPDGKDRRAIDPPPVLQLLMHDFDPESQDDLNELKSSFWVVHCRLVSPSSPKKDMSTLSSVAEDGSREIQRLLLGTAVASPFHTIDDPDAERVPTHPVTKNKASRSGPPSPSSRFLPNSSTRSTTENVKSRGKGKSASKDPAKIPSAFFIFADLSVRKAGDYRLEFSLMKIEAAMMMTGSTLPIIHSVTSQVFKVVNAKDFDQVQPSTKLVRGLLERGAGFPLKLKKGTREGQRRKGRTDSDSSDNDEDDDDDDEEKSGFGGGEPPPRGDLARIISKPAAAD